MQVVDLPRPDSQASADDTVWPLQLHPYSDFEILVTAAAASGNITSYQRMRIMWCLHGRRGSNAIGNIIGP